jgi:uncharacterized membrane protein YhaH (DUF805 family)
MHWYTDVLRKYAVFGGRARRREYWMFTLVNLIISGILYGLYFSTRSTILAIIVSLYSLAVLLPSLGVLIRRLHDTGRTGWWFFIPLIPLVGAVWLFVLTVLNGTRGPNRYGPDPKAVTGTY